ncbi:hypothetical protein [Paenibacillus sp. FSL K6-1230]|uniref:hypothetical protein n=1 Tax=Paenibacillus sp. FSL K6-1230 TaxID=2921603 RepID=UPI000399B635
MEIKELNLEEGSIENVEINSKYLGIELKRWDQSFVKIIINDYTKFVEFDSIGREISEFVILDNSEFLEDEKEKLLRLDFDEEEINQLIYVKFIGLSDLPLLEVIANKNEIQVKKIPK